jgi:hypothetical protein
LEHSAEILLQTIKIRRDQKNPGELVIGHFQLLVRSAF